MSKRQIRYCDQRGQTKVAWRWESQVQSFCEKLDAAGMTQIEIRPRGFSGWRPFSQTKGKG